MASQKQTPKAVKQPAVKQQTIKEIEIKKADTAPKADKSAEYKSAVQEIVAQAKARVTRLAQTNISMSCREVIAMLNGIKDGIEKL